MNQAMNQSMNQTMNQSLNPSVNQYMIHESFNESINESIIEPTTYRGEFLLYFYFDELSGQKQPEKTTERHKSQHREPEDW